MHWVLVELINPGRNVFPAVDAQVVIPLER